MCYSVCWDFAHYWLVEFVAYENTLSYATWVVLSGDWKHRFLWKELGGRNWLLFACFVCLCLKCGTLWFPDDEDELLEDGAAAELLVGVSLWDGCHVRLLFQLIWKMWLNLIQVPLRQCNVPKRNTSLRHALASNSVQKFLVICLCKTRTKPRSEWLVYFDFCFVRKMILFWLGVSK